MGKCVGCHVTKIGGWKPGRFLHILQFVMKQAKAFTRKPFPVYFEASQGTTRKPFPVYYEASQDITWKLCNLF